MNFVVICLEKYVDSEKFDWNFKEVLEIPMITFSRVFDMTIHYLFQIVCYSADCKFRSSLRAYLVFDKMS